MNPRLPSSLSVALVAAGLAAGCAARAPMIPGTRIPQSPANKAVLEAVEAYRTAVERGDADALLLMAHKDYWEDGGTVSGSDDYGYDGLAAMLKDRLPKASEVRYSMRYVAIRQTCAELKAGCRAFVDVLIDGSFTVNDAMGKPRRPDKRDQNQLVLEWSGDRWLFLSGM